MPTKCAKQLWSNSNFFTKNLTYFIIAGYLGNEHRKDGSFCIWSFLLDNHVAGLEYEDLRHKKGRKRFAYGLIGSYLQYIYEIFSRLPANKGGGRIWIGKRGFFCKPSCLINWCKNSPIFPVVTQQPNTARTNHITSSWYLCTFILWPPKRPSITIGLSSVFPLIKTIALGLDIQTPTKENPQINTSWAGSKDWGAKHCKSILLFQSDLLENSLYQYWYAAFLKTNASITPTENLKLLNFFFHKKEVIRFLSWDRPKAKCSWIIGFNRLLLRGRNKGKLGSGQRTLQMGNGERFHWLKPFETSPSTRFGWNLCCVLGHKTACPEIFR